MWRRSSTRSGRCRSRICRKKSRGYASALLFECQMEIELLFLTGKAVVPVEFMGPGARLNSRRNAQMFEQPDAVP